MPMTAGFGSCWRWEGASRSKEQGLPRGKEMGGGIFSHRGATQEGDMPQQGEDLCMQRGEKEPVLDPVGTWHPCGWH